MAEFLKGHDQIGHGPSPAIQAPNDDDINVAATSGIEHLLPQLTHRSTGADFFHIDGNGPAASGGVVAHRTALQ